MGLMHGPAQRGGDLFGHKAALLDLPLEDPIALGLAKPNPLTRRSLVSHQYSHARRCRTHRPSSKLVRLCATMASPRRFFQQTNPWYANPQRMPASQWRCSKPKTTDVTRNGIQNHAPMGTDWKSTRAR